MKSRAKRVVASFLAFVLVLSTVSVSVSGSVTFVDISNTYPAAREAIQKWAGYGIVQGVGNGRFDPFAHISRHQVAIIIGRIMGYTETSPNNFEDLQDDSWFAPYILRAVNAGVFDSYGNFRAEEYITREEAAMALARALGISIRQEDSGPTHFIDDDEISPQSRAAIHAVLRHGIIQGFYVGGELFEFRPQANILRQDMMVMLSNAIYTIVSESATGIDTDRFVIVNSPNAAITDSVISNLIISQGVGTGSISLNDVQIREELLVRSGADSALNIHGDTTVPNLRVLLAAEHNLLTINADSYASITSLFIEQGTVRLSGEIFVENATMTDVGHLIVDRDATIGRLTVPSYVGLATVTIDGHVNELIVHGDYSSIQMNGSVDVLDIMGNNVTVYVYGQVNELVVAGDNSTVIIHGDVDNTLVLGDNTTIYVYGGLGEVEDNGENTIIIWPRAGENDEPRLIGTQNEQRPSGGGSSGSGGSGSGGGGSTPTPPPPPPAGLVLAIVPETAAVPVGGTFEFSAHRLVGGLVAALPAGTNVTWSIVGAVHTGTTISNQGVLTVHADETIDDFIVRATVTGSNPAIFASAVVAIVDMLPPENIHVASYDADTTTLSWDTISGIAPGVYYVIYRSTGVFGDQIEVGRVPAGTTTWTYPNQGSSTPLSQAFYFRIAARVGPDAGVNVPESALSEDWASRETDFWGPNVLIWSEDDDYNEINDLAQGIFREPGTGWHFFYNSAGVRETRPCPHTGGPSAGMIYLDDSGNYIRGRGTETAQFGDERYAFFFKPGDFSNVGFDVGFYTHIVGLGMVPTDTRIGRLSVTAQWRGTVHYPARNPSLPDRNYIGNSTCNFWRTMENVHLLSNTMWGVSQAAPLRRLYVDGSLTVATIYPSADGGNWASGGFLADSIIRGNLSYTGQQQWFTRNTEYAAATGGQWNMVHVGTVGDSPAHGFNEGRWTNIPQAPRTVEKPFVYINDAGHYSVFVPSLQLNTSGVSWCPATRNMGAGASIPVIGNFYIAKPDTSTAASIQNAINNAGLDVIITPGIYNLSHTINVNRDNAIILGLGLPSLVNQGNFEHMIIDDVDGVRIAGIIFDAGEGFNAPIMLQVGINSRAHNAYHGLSNPITAADPNNPIVISDVVFRIGGPIEARIGTAVEIRRDHAIGDHFWAWRADHGVRPWDYEVYGKLTQVGWFLNETVNGTVIYADDFVMYALMNEHFHEYQLIWFGERGRLYFYQSEVPYDPRTQAEWTPGPGTRGWTAGDSTLGFASYKVHANVQYHEAWGIGIYGVPSNTGGTGFTQRNPYPVFVQLGYAIEVPRAPGVHIWHACILNFANPMITLNAGYPGNGMPCPVRSHPRFYSEFGGDLNAAIAGLVGQPTYNINYPAIAHVINGVGGGTWATVRSGWVMHYNNPLVGTVEFYINNVPAPAMGRYSQQPLVELRFNDPTAEIRFTLDGTQPTPTSTLYTDPFPVGVLESLVQVRAAAFRPDGTGGATAATYIRVGLSRSNNVARFRPVRASSETGGQPARGAVDGLGGRADGTAVTNERWAAADLNTGNPAMAQWGRRNQWFIVDLEAETPISEIVITWQSQAGRLTEGQIAFSNDPTVWGAPIPWTEGLFGREGPRTLDPRWLSVAPPIALGTMTPTVRYPNPAFNTPLEMVPPTPNVVYTQVDLGGRRPRHTVDLTGENITARFVLIDIRSSFDFPPSIWELEIYASIASPFTIEGIVQPLEGATATAPTITTPDTNISLSNIQMTGATGAGNIFEAGDVPQITLTATVDPVNGGFNEAVWSSGSAAGLILALGSASITFTRVSDTVIDVTISLMPIAPRFSITAPTTVTVNGLTLAAEFRDSLGIVRNEFAEGEVVTVVLHATGTQTDASRASIWEVDLTSAQVDVVSGREPLNMLAASYWTMSPAGVLITPDFVVTAHPAETPDLDAAIPPTETPDLDAATPPAETPDLDAATPPAETPDLDVTAPPMEVPDLDAATPPAETPDLDIATPPAEAPDSDAATPPTEAPDLDVTAQPAEAPGLGIPTLPAKAQGFVAAVTSIETPDSDVAIPPAETPDLDATSPPTETPDSDTTSPPTEAPDSYATSPPAETPDSNAVMPSTIISIAPASVATTSQTFNLRPGANPGAGNPLYPAAGFIYTFIMPDAAVTDLTLHFDARFNILGYFERNTATDTSQHIDRARASALAGAPNPLRQAVNAFNGLYNGDNRWESPSNDASGRSSHPGWIMVDLGAVYDVSDVVITWQSQNASSPAFQILLTDDVSLWNDPRAIGVNANVTGALSQEVIDNWLSWRADTRWNVAWDVYVGARTTATLTSFASLSRGTTTLIPWRAGTDGAVTFAPRGDVTTNSGGVGRYLLFWGDLNGNAGGAFGYSIWEIEVYGTFVSP